MQCCTQKLAGLHDGSTAKMYEQLSLKSMQHCFSEIRPSPCAALTMYTCDAMVVKPQDVVCQVRVLVCKSRYNSVIIVEFRQLSSQSNWTCAEWTEDRYAVEAMSHKAFLVGWLGKVRHRMNSIVTLNRLCKFIHCQLFQQPSCHNVLICKSVSWLSDTVPGALVSRHWPCT